MVGVFSNWVSFEDANCSKHRLKKHLFVFLAVLVGVITSGLAHAVDVQRANSDKEVEQSKTSVVVGNRTEKSSSPSSMDSILIESLFRSGFYSATFDRICQKQTSRYLVTGSTGSPAAELTSQDRPHSTRVNSSERPSGGAVVRLRRSSARRSCDKTRWNEILKSSECRKIDLGKAKTNDSRSVAAALKNMDAVDSECAEDEEHSLGCYPIPQVVHLADICSQIPVEVDVTVMRTIIHACPSISCCVKGHRCQVKQYAKVNKSFMVGEDQTITISFRNHTECACALSGRKSTNT